MARAEVSLGHVELRGVTDWLAFRLLPVATATTLALVLLFSDVGQTFVWMPVGLVEAVWVVYAALLVAVAVTGHGQLHRAGAFLAVLVFGSRGIAFAELAFERGSWALTGAVSERVLLALFAVVWHIRGMQRHVLAGGRHRWMQN